VPVDGVALFGELLLHAHVPTLRDQPPSRPSHRPTVTPRVESSSQGSRHHRDGTDEQEHDRQAGEADGQIVRGGGIAGHVPLA